MGQTGVCSFWLYNRKHERREEALVAHDYCRLGGSLNIRFSISSNPQNILVNGIIISTL